MHLVRVVHLLDRLAGGRRHQRQQVDDLGALFAVQPTLHPRGLRYEKPERLSVLARLMHCWMRSGESTRQTYAEQRTNDGDVAVLRLRRLAHLLRAVPQRHDAASLADLRLRQVEVDVVALVEAVDNVAGDFDVLQLIISYGNI